MLRSFRQHLEVRKTAQVMLYCRSEGAVKFYAVTGGKNVDWDAYPYIH